MEKLNIKRKKTKKTQILLYDTQRRVEDFINKIKYRNNGQYEDIPHFVISKLGIVHEIFDTDYSSKTFDDHKVDRKIIKIALENLGWLNKNTITGVLNNWIGDPYRAEPHIRGWRNYFFWDKYTDIQLETTYNLCEALCKKHDIPEKMVTSQGYMENASNFKGIICKSNYSNIYTDINPSFNFNIFFKNAEQNEYRL
jgi:hypothetical protein